MSESLAYFNGRMLPQSQAVLPLYDAGLIFGAVATDLVRTFRFRPFRLADHLARFRRSCHAACIPQPVADEEIAEIAQRLVSHNAALFQPTQDLAVVMFATPGPVHHYGGLAAEGEAPPTLILHTFPLPFHRYVRYLREGVRLVIPHVRHVPAACVDPRIKQRSRLHWWLADQEAQQADAGSMALLLDADGHVTETASANLVVVHGNTAVIPPRGSVLGGVSLTVVEELCGELGIAFTERPLTPYDVANADEVLVTCTSFCLAGVSRVNGRPIPWPGPLFERLVRAWNARVNLDVHAQILTAPP